MKKLFILSIFLVQGITSFAQNTGNTSSSGNANMSVETRDAFYPGGQPALDKYIFDHLTYTPEAKAAKASGNLMVSFYVERDSTISDVKVMQDVGYGVGDKTKEVIKSMKYAPALINGMAIRSKIMIYVPVRAH